MVVESTYTINGLVRDGVSMQPLPGVQILVGSPNTLSSGYGRTLQTDGMGEFVFWNLGSGPKDQLARFSGPNYHSLELLLADAVVRTGDHEYRLEVDLMPR